MDVRAKQRLSKCLKTAEVGRSLGRYKILKPPGAGGMGEVYLAEGARLERKIALKILPKSVAQDEEMKLALLFLSFKIQVQTRI